MTWPFENNTNGIVKNLAKRNLKSEKRRNVMVIVSVVLSALRFLFEIFLTIGLVSFSKGNVINAHTPYPTIFPSSILTMRSASCAIALLCVIITTVW